MKNKTKTFTLWVPYHTGISVEVKAETEDEAVALAKDRVENETMDADWHNQIIDNLQRDGVIDVVED